MIGLFSLAHRRLLSCKISLNATHCLFPLFNPNLLHGWVQEFDGRVGLKHGDRCTDMHN